MCKRSVISLFFISSFISASCQQFGFGFLSGIATYSMQGLKNINTSVIQGLPFDAKIVDNFPAYFYYQPKMVLSFGNFAFGLVCSFQSSGSRVSAKDYSGEYRFDMKVRSNSPGIYTELRISTEDRFNFNLYSIVGPSFTNLEIQEYFNIANTILTNSINKYKAQNYYFEPGINFQVPVKAISFSLSLGYLIHIGDQAFYSGSDKKNVLYDTKNNVKVSPDWRGLRAGLSVCYSFIKQK